jgi:hypothetical protein
MTPVRATFLQAAEYAAGLLADPAVAARWDDPSALADMSVGALAGHLARQVLLVRRQLTEPAGVPETNAPISLLDHYDRVAWAGAGPQDEANVSIRRSSAAEAADGPARLAARTADAAGWLRGRLSAEPAERAVFLPWGPWALTLDDMLRTRTMEIAVHGDDLSCSADLGQAPVPDAVAEEAIALLTRLALRRHGPAAVLRALSRAERAPATIAAF